METHNSPFCARLNEPDEHVTKGGAQIDVVLLNDLRVKRQRFPQGWRFSTHMGASSCGDTHVGYMVSGHMHVRLDDGREFDIHGEDVFMIPAGHDAWVIGDEPCTVVQFDEGDSAARRFGVEELRRKAA